MPKPYSKDSLNLWNLKHLAYRLGVSEKLLLETAESVGTSYRRWPKWKPSGGIRWITTPKRKLKRVQKRVNRLLTEIRLSQAAHCGVKKRSNYTHAKVHAGNKVVFQLDIKDFYPSISHYRIYHMFRNELECSKEVANLLTKLCTINGSVPQGAPTSTTIANLICRKLDDRLIGLAENYSTKYSRFNDDFAFSGSLIPESFKEKVRDIVTQQGYELNVAKEITAKASQPQIVTGLNINRKLPRVPKKIRMMWRREKYVLEKYGSNELPQSDYEKRKRSLIGKANYLAFINRKKSKADTFQGDG